MKYYQHKKTILFVAIISMMSLVVQSQELDYQALIKRYFPDLPIRELDYLDVSMLRKTEKNSILKDFFTKFRFREMRELLPQEIFKNSSFICYANYSHNRNLNDMKMLEENDHDSLVKNSTLGNTKFIVAYGAFDQDILDRLCRQRIITGSQTYAGSYKIYNFIPPGSIANAESIYLTITSSKDMVASNSQGMLLEMIAVSEGSRANFLDNPDNQVLSDLEDYLNTSFCISFTRESYKDNIVAFESKNPSSMDLESFRENLDAKAQIKIETHSYGKHYISKLISISGSEENASLEENMFKRLGQASTNNYLASRMAKSEIERKGNIVIVSTEYDEQLIQELNNHIQSVLESKRGKKALQKKDPHI